MRELVTEEGKSSAFTVIICVRQQHISQSHLFTKVLRDVVELVHTEISPLLFDGQVSMDLSSGTITRLTVVGFEKNYFDNYHLNRN